MKVVHPYAPRPVGFAGLEEIDNCLVKVYTITWPDNSVPGKKDLEVATRLFREKRTEYSGMDEADIGYLIIHKGMDCNYIVCCWWSHENMLRMFSFSSPLHDSAKYEPVNNGLDICVWDMLIHSYERDAFVRHYLMEPENSNKEAYVRDIYTGEKGYPGSLEKSPG